MSGIHDDDTYEPDEADEIPGERRLLPELWKACIKGWKTMVAGFGDSTDLMRWVWMRALDHRALGHWLRALEDLVRSTILIDALTRDVPALPRAYRRSTPRTGPAPYRNSRYRPFDPKDPATWRTSFRMLKLERNAEKERPIPDAILGHTPRSARPDPDAMLGHAPRRRSPPAERRYCVPFALRIEALRRAILYRDTHARRYARRLARLAEHNRRVNDKRKITGLRFDLRQDRDFPGLENPPRPVPTARRLVGYWNTDNAPTAKHFEPG